MQLLVLTDYRPKAVKIFLKDGNIVECKMMGTGVENAIKNVLMKKYDPLILKIVGDQKTTYLNTEDISYIETRP